jgi:hypothetical protein
MEVPVDAETKARETRCAVEAGRKNLTLHKNANERWEVGSLAGDEWLLAGDRVRLPDGREIAREMTLDELEAFLFARS